jgi:predicted transposase/invertase (TIGR01784 family)
MSKHIRFDWAMKRLLRNKANFDVLEGFLSVLLNDKITIKEILESESNKEDDRDKFNRTDILVKNQKDELCLIEVQNERERDYFHRMNYGQAKLLTEHIDEGDAYENIKKIYSVNIVYFDLGQGTDYLYEGKTEFTGMRTGDILQLNKAQKKAYAIKNVSDIFTKYYLIKVNNFNDLAKDDIDQWIYFLKNSEIKDNFTAPGLQQAKEKLRRDNLSKEEKVSYDLYIKQKRIQENELVSAIQEGELKAEEKYLPVIEQERRQKEEERRQKEEERRQKEEAKQREEEAKQREEEAKQREEEAKQRVIDLAKLLKSMNMPFELIAEKTGLSKEEIERL